MAKADAIGGAAGGMGGGASGMLQPLLRMGGPQHMGQQNPYQMGIGAGLNQQPMQGLFGNIASQMPQANMLPTSNQSVQSFLNPFQKFPMQEGQPTPDNNGLYGGWMSGGVRHPGNQPGMMYIL